MFSIRQVTGVGRTYLHLNRYRQILQVFFKYGFDELLDVLKIDQLVEFGRQKFSSSRRERVESLTGPERLRLALEELGPTFIKLGQVLSTRPDLIPLPFALELSRLQDQVPPFPYPEAAEAIRKALGKGPEEIFSEFEKKPLAAASIGQVHRAVLPDGTEVAVKVRRPAIRKTIEIDLEIMNYLAGLMERHLTEFHIIRPQRIVKEFARTLEEEIDYTVEAGHVERFADQFEGREEIVVPRVFRDFSSEGVLTLEHIDGVKASNLDKLRGGDYDCRVLAERGADLMMAQIFEYGFFHADPHPGNIFILPDNVICYLDFGMMGRISREERERFADLLLAVVRKDEARAAEAILELTEHDGDPDRGRFEREIGAFIDRYLYRPLKDIKMGEVLQKLLDLAVSFELTIKPNLYLMMKAISQVESLGTELDPEFEIISRARPFVERIQWARFHPKRLAEEIFASGTDLISLLQDIPAEFRSILRQTRAGKLNIVFQHRGLEKLRTTLDQTGNRVAYAIVLAALIVGSSLVVLSGIPPTWNNIPLIGLIGFLVAGLMGFGLLITIIKHGKM
jgi:ubiquinone biosynthesis protein